MFLTMPIQTEGYSQEHLAWISERYIDVKYLILNEQEIQLFFGHKAKGSPVHVPKTKNQGMMLGFSQDKKTKERQLLKRKQQSCHYLQMMWLAIKKKSQRIDR